jgi:hypothetical protein
MNIENTPWLFTAALSYAFLIVVLIFIELLRKSFVPKKWKTQAILLGMAPMFIILLLTILSMATEMLYLLPEYAPKQQLIIKLLDTAYGYNNNLLVMIPMAFLYFVVLNISQNKKILFDSLKFEKNKFQMNSTYDCIQAMDASSAFLRQREIDAERQQNEHDEKVKKEEDDWVEANSKAAEDEYWHGRPGY